MKSSKLFFLIAMLLSSTGQISADIYLPSLPYIAHTLNTSFNWIQFSIAAFMLGFCSPRIAFGIFSDAFGRRYPIFIGLMVGLVGTLFCLFAQNVYILIIGRFFQGLGTSGCATLAGSMIRDQYDGSDLIKFNSYFSMANVTLMASIPVIGGIIQKYLFWQANFIFILILILSVLFLFKIAIGETNIHRDKSHLKWSSIKKNIKTLFKSKSYLGFVGCIFLSYSGILAWLTLGPILLQHQLHISPLIFGIICGGGGLSCVVGGFISSQKIKHWGSYYLIITGLYLYLTSGISLLLIGWFCSLNVWLLIIPVYLFILGAGMLFPNAYSCAVMPFPKIAGIATAILGTMQILGGFTSSTIISLLPHNVSWPLAMVMITSGFIGLILFKELCGHETKNIT